MAQRQRRLRRPLRWLADALTHGKLDPIWTRAENGNVALTGEIDFTQADEVTLALGFGRHPEEAAHRVRSSLNFGFEQAPATITSPAGGTPSNRRVRSGPASPPDVRDCYRTSVAVMLSHEP